MKRCLRPRATAELSKSLQQQLNTYALAAAAAGVGLLALAPHAEAKIIYTPTHAKVVSGQALPLDLNHDGIVDFNLVAQGSIVGTDIVYSLAACQFIGQGSRGAFCINSFSTNLIRNVGVFAAALRPGAEIEDGKRFRSNGVVLGKIERTYSHTYWQGPWFNGGKGVKNRYLGLKFKVKGRFHFGWARITVTTTKNRFTTLLTGYAYETIPGKAIIAGATKGPDDELTTSFNTHVPQAATLGMLALGAPGLSIWKREESAGATTERN
jgi:hypothetical protein